MEGTTSPDAGVLRTIWSGLGRDVAELTHLAGPRHPVPLPARTDVPTLAWTAVTAASCAASALTGPVQHCVDPDRVAVAYGSLVEIDGARPGMFAPLSGFFRTADGWVRTHANYPHHAEALRRGLGVPQTAERDEVAGCLARLTAEHAVDAVEHAGGLCVAVSAEDEAEDARLRASPVIGVRPLVSAPPHPLPDAPRDAPLRGVRVLDLTRVIAGPVGTRTLALLGADVLRIDPPRLPEIEAQHFDTGHGKRSALLDLTDPRRRARFDQLLAEADVVALGYRATSLARLGITAHSLAHRHPGVVVAQHTAWDDPDRRGFDSLVQPAAGIALIEGSPHAPGALPVQALDHTTGYLLAAGVITALARRAAEGGSWLVSTSLRRVAAELLALPRTPVAPALRSPSADAHTQSFEIDGHTLTTAAPAVAYPGGPTAFSAPRRWGRDPARWPARQTGRSPRAPAR